MARSRLFANTRRRASCRRPAAAAVLATVLAAAPAIAAGPEISWFSIVTATGAPVGYARVEERDTGGGTERIEYQETTLREQDARPTRLTERTVIRYDRAGRLVSISSESSTGSRRTWVEARPAPGGYEIIRQTPSGLSAVTVAVGPEVRFDGGEALLAAWNPAASPRLEFLAFNLDAMGTERVVIAPLALAGGHPGERTVLRATYDGAELRGVSRLTLGPDGRVLSVVQPMYGASLTMRPSDQATALGPRAPMRTMTTMMVKSPFRIPAGAAQGHIRYRFGFRDGMRFDLPQTGEQRVALLDGAAVVDICDGCGPGLPADEATLAAARRPTAWLQSNDPRLRSLVAPVAALNVTDSRKMEMLSDKTRSLIEEIDFAGHYSASETLDRRRGDCTETAVLLAAFGRAAGIPTRTVSGFVYSRERYHGVSNVFMPHSWTLAYVDGRWRSFDAALTDFDATHIAITVGDGDVRSMAASGQLASLLTWEGMQEVRARPTG